MQKKISIELHDSYYIPYNFDLIALLNIYEVLSLR